MAVTRGSGGGYQIHYGGGLAEVEAQADMKRPSRIYIERQGGLVRDMGDVQGGGGPTRSGDLAEELGI